VKLFPNPIDYARLLDHPAVVKQAGEIGSCGALNGRTRAEKQEHSLKGVALEHAVRLELGDIGAELGWNILPPADQTHDIVLETGSTERFKIDVKGLFNPDARTITLYSGWELDNADSDTIYLVFKCDGESATYAGYFTLWDLEEGKYGPFVWVSKLKRDNPFS